MFISADGPLLEGQEHANALGNHLGIWDFNLQWSSNEKNTVFITNIFLRTQVA